MTAVNRSVAPPLASQIIAAAGAVPLAMPYRGISSYRFIDQGIFFAREADVRRLLRLVTIYRGVLFYGESGVGKSSLLNAAFVPEAIGEGFMPEFVRVQAELGAEITIRRIATTEDPNGPYLPSIFVDDQQVGPAVTLSVEEFLRRIETQAADGATPLLIFDQFEELVSRFEEAPKAGALSSSLNIQQKLIDALARLLTNHVIPVKTLLSFREDYLAKFTKLLQRVPDLGDRFIRIAALRTDDLEEVIGRPLREVLESTTADANAKARAEALTPLVPSLVAEFSRRYSERPVVPTEVQIACMKLWSVPDPVRFFHDPAPDSKKAGVEKILEAYFADEVAKFGAPRRAEKQTAEQAKVSRQKQDAIGPILSRLVTRTGVRNFVSRDNLSSQVATEVGLTSAQVDEVLAELDGRDTRLVSKEVRQDGVEYYTIISEFLVPWIRRWKDEREKIRLREERDKERRWFLGVSAVALLLLLSSAYSLIMYNRVKDRENEIKLMAVENSRMRALNDSIAQDNVVRANQTVELTRAGELARARHDSLVQSGEDSARALITAAMRRSQTLDASVKARLDSLTRRISQLQRSGSLRDTLNGALSDLSSTLALLRKAQRDLQQRDLELVARS